MNPDDEYYARKEQDARDDRETATRYCEHKVDGPRRNVTVDIDNGVITAILCADCELPIQLDIGTDEDNDYEVVVHAEGVPMVLITSVEWVAPEPGYAEYLEGIYHQLTAEEAHA